VKTFVRTDLDSETSAPSPDGNTVPILKKLKLSVVPRYHLLSTVVDKIQTITSLLASDLTGLQNIDSHPGQYDIP